MRVTLDDRPCEISPRNVGEAIAEAADLAGRDGRIIVEVLVDGSPWSETELAEPENVTREAEDVQLTSADPRELVTQTLQQADEALEMIATHQSAAAEHIQSNRAADAMEQLNEAITLWMSVQQVVQRGTQVLDIDLDQVTVGNKPVNTYIEQLNDRLRLLRDQLQAQDHLGLADTLMYDLPEVVDAWSQLIQGLRKHVGEGE